MKFDEFKLGPPRGILSALGPTFLAALDGAPDYLTFRQLIVEANGGERGQFVKAARSYGGVCSGGERELLKAILHLVDFSHVADEMSGGEAYFQMTRCAGEFRRAFAACVINAG